MGNYIKGHTYLIRLVDGRMKLTSITILLVTNTAFYVRWNKGLESTDTWESTSKFSEEYSIVEDITEYITDFMDETQTRTYSIKECPRCNGIGTILDKNSTSGVKTCPVCFGNKTVST